MRHEDGALDLALKGTMFYVISNRVPNGRVIAFDAANQDYSKGKEFLPESDLILTANRDEGLLAAQDALYPSGRLGGAGAPRRRIGYSSVPLR
jgi:hypothetical protein